MQKVLLGGQQKFRNSKAPTDLPENICKGYTVNGSPVQNLGGTQAISVFSGAGGLDIGSQLAGVRVIASLDFDRDSVETMRSNCYFDHVTHMHEDIQNVTGYQYRQVIRKNKPDKLILIGGPPCQPFSKAGYWVTHKNRLGKEDPRNMIGQYLRLIEEIKPDGFMLENVESILHPKNVSAVTELTQAIESLGFHHVILRVNAADYGVPQKRKRVFFVASRKSINGFIQPTHGTEKDIESNPRLRQYEKVVDWIGDFSDNKYFEPEETIDGKTYEHELREIPPGMNYFALTEREGYPYPKFQPNTRFWSFLLKLHPEQPSWTIAAQPGPWVGPFHWHNRRLRVPEIAAIQTFPRDYQFYGSRRSVQRQIGNAVPPLLAKHVIKYLKDSL